MQPRLVVGGGPSNGFPRWGYLDKFAVNEYLPRAFGVTAGVTIAVVASLQLWWPAAELDAPVTVRPLPILDTVSPVLPTILPVRPKVGTTAPQSSHRPIAKFVPVSGPVADDLPTEGGAATGAVSDAPASGDSPREGVVDAGGSGEAWPSPDDWIAVEQEPVLVTMQTPVYPEIARDAGIDGTVLVRALVDSQGLVRDVRLLQGVRGLDEAALAAVRTAAFRPAMQQGSPVAVWVVIPIEFRLHD
jgi:protein TonB